MTFFSFIGRHIELLNHDFKHGKKYYLWIGISKSIIRQLGTTYYKYATFYNIDLCMYLYLGMKIITKKDRALKGFFKVFIDHHDT